MVKKICILGSTGSIGQQTLEVAEHLGDIEVVGLAANSGGALFEEQIRKWQPKIVALSDRNAAHMLQKKFSEIEVLAGPEGVETLAGLDEIDTVVAGIVGTAALRPVVAALKKNKRVALASKEVLVAAGDLVMRLGGTIIPVDSEHSALFQCLQGGDETEIRRLVLTASGGPFRGKSLNELQDIRVEDALAHPTWSMGAKISVDSSTLMNKGLEVIEAHVLFGVPLDQIEVVVHPQSIIHSMVEWCDGSIFAQMSDPSMHLPIQYALTYPKRGKAMSCFDFTKSATLTFQKPDERICLQLAYAAAKEGGSAPCYLNGANEVLVQRFLDREIGWIEIGEKLERLMQRHNVARVSDIESVLELDREARAKAKEI